MRLIPNRWLVASSSRLASVVMYSVLLTSLVTACGTGGAVRPTANPPERFPHHTAVEIARYLQSGTDTLYSFKTVSRAAIASPEGSSQFTAVVDHRRNDSVRIDIRVQFGIEAARILFTPDSFFVYDRVKKTLYYGDTGSAGSLLPLPWKSPDLFLDILGLSAVDVDEAWSVEADSSRYYMTSRDGRTTLFVDPAVWRIVRSEARDSAGAMQEERTFLDFGVFDGVVLPRRIVIRRPTERISATISHRSITLNPDRLDLEFEVAGDARHVQIF